MSGKNHPAKDLALTQNERRRLDREQERLDRRNKKLAEEIKALERKKDDLVKSLQELKAKRRNDK